MGGFFFCVLEMMAAELLIVLHGYVFFRHERILLITIQLTFKLMVLQFWILVTLTGKLMTRHAYPNKAKLPLCLYDAM
jgi:hypothetical protein